MLQAPYGCSNDPLFLGDIVRLEEKPHRAATNCICVRSRSARAQLHFGLPELGEFKAELLDVEKFKDCKTWCGWLAAYTLQGVDEGGLKGGFKGGLRGA